MLNKNKINLFWSSHYCNDRTLILFANQFSFYLYEFHLIFNKIDQQYKILFFYIYVVDRWMIMMYACCVFKCQNQRILDKLNSLVLSLLCNIHTHAHSLALLSCVFLFSIYLSLYMCIQCVCVSLWYTLYI